MVDEKEMITAEEDGFDKEVLKVRRPFNFDNADLGLLGLTLLGICLMIVVGFAASEDKGLIIGILASIINGIIALAKISEKK